MQAPQYTPAPLPKPDNLPNVARHVNGELQKLADVLSGVRDILLPTLHVAPSKIVDGMIVLADGTDWNPGSGKGFYGYHTGAWHFLG